MSKPYMKLEFINEFGDKTVVEYESSTYRDGEAMWMYENFRQFMMACGFHPDTVNDYLPEE